MATDAQRKKFTVPQLALVKNSSRRLAMVTAYDATFASIIDAADVDLLLVGDSVATVMQGQKNTLGVSMEQMEYHVQMVSSAKPFALVVGDLPFGSYQASVTDAVQNSIRLIKAGAELVKLEGGVHVADQIAAITNADIPVMGHIGLTPQSYHRMGGNKIQGRAEGDIAGSKDRLMKDALAVQDAGACAVVIEGVPSDVAASITKSLSIPTIGIGAGVGCDGQVLVMHDLLGLSPRTFTFAKPYAQLRNQAIAAVAQYVQEVQSGAWPDSDHSFS
ncbi:MAG: 3-methyl-2-oxobutanoate hydroxymethyltransferase [Actinobacteria bacterium]|uniref:3-methyl-2-oxobutanoate hydroxymethyltransferase n=1 Tax=freshwater metagenome TaxID=449393 RepID=A0A6J6IM91_9ZZZZ|nr:3-methyl-2-oxobutanoate hydroxymethyltransferase [Actinomycetota bacterium]